MKTGKRTSVPNTPDRNQIEAAYPIIAQRTGISPDRARRLLHEVYEILLETAPEPPKGGLSGQQHRAMQFIQDYIDENGHAPTRDQISEATNIRPACNVTRILKAIENKGFIWHGSGWREITIRIRI